MKKLLSLGLSLLILAGPAARAEPLTALFALVLADKVIENDNKEAVDNNKNWRQALSNEEIGALQQIKQHPAIQACIKEANDNHPAAQYHLRKIAQFSIRVKQDVEDHGYLSDMQQYAYLHPGKGFNWCKQQAGMQASNKAQDIKQAAYQLAQTNLGNNSANLRVAMNK